MYKRFAGSATKGRDIGTKMLGRALNARTVCRIGSIVCVCVPPFHSSPNPWSLLLSPLLISQQWALFLQMAPQSAVYLAWPNLWVYANGQPGWGPAASVRILTTMCCFGGTRRGVFGGGGGGVIRGGVIVAVCVVVEGGGGELMA